MNTEQPDPEIRLRRFEHSTIVPMLVLSVLFVPVLVIPLLCDLTPWQDHVFQVVDSLIWLCFLTEYATRLVLARDRVHFMATNLVDLAIIALPLIRVVTSIRMVRILQASRIVFAGLRGRKLGDDMVSHHSVAAMAFVIVSLSVSAAALVYDVERHAPGSRIHTVGDAFWWAIVTVSTVGYGDFYPVTTAGRVIAGCLMFVGVCTSALIAAAFAAIFIKDKNEEEFDPKLAALAERLDRIDGLLLRLELTVESHEEKAIEREALAKQSS